MIEANSHVSPSSFLPKKFQNTLDLGTKIVYFDG